MWRVAVGVAMICAAGCPFRLPSAPGVPDDARPPPSDAPPPEMPVFDLACLSDPSYAARPASSHRYRLIETALDYDSAVERCAVDDAHLAVIDDVDENAFVRTLSPSDLWIGYDDLTTEGTFTWVTGAAQPFTNWGADEPNNVNGIEDCAYIRSDATWNDTSCADHRGLVCECDSGFKPAAPPACRELAGATVLDGRHYFLRTAVKSWAEAETDCESIGATLAAISDVDENDAIAGRFAADVWIGYSDIATEGTFVWSNQAPFGFEHWNGSSPSTGTTGDSEDCAHIDFPNRDWNDSECTAPKQYACECDPAPP